MDKKIWLSKKNIGNGIFILILTMVLFVPAIKALMIQGLMEIGLFKPTIPLEEKFRSEDLSKVGFTNQANTVLRLGDLKGKVVFINFWATWCAPCLAEMPSINKLYGQLKSDSAIVFMSIDADGDFKKAHGYLLRKQFELPLYHITQMPPKSIFDGSLPTTVVINKKGKIAYHGVGAADYANPKFVKFIESLKMAQK